MKLLGSLGYENPEVKYFNIYQLETKHLRKLIGHLRKVIKENKTNKKMRTHFLNLDLLDDSKRLIDILRFHDLKESYRLADFSSLKEKLPKIFDVLTKPVKDLPLYINHKNELLRIIVQWRLQNNI